MRVVILTVERVGEVVQGGVGHFVNRFGAWLESQGIRTKIVCRSLFFVRDFDGRYLNTPPKKKAQSYSVPYFISQAVLLTFMLLSVLQILKLNKRGKISLIHAQDTGYSGLAAVLTAKLLDVPVLVSSHGIRTLTLKHTLNGIMRCPELMIEHAIDVLVCRNANAIIAVSKLVRDYIIDLGANERKTYVVPIGVSFPDCNVDAQKNGDRAEESSDNEDQTIIGFIGRLSPEKNPEFLMTAYSQIAQNLPSSHLMFIGDGPLMATLQEHSRIKHTTEYVRFMGERNDVPRLLKMIDIFVIPSKVEGCPTILLEAMSSGRAIIASDIASIREIVKQGEEAILVNPYDCRELEQAILLLYDNPKLRENLGKKARERAKIYDVAKVYGQTLKVYEELIRHGAKENIGPIMHANETTRIMKL